MQVKYVFDGSYTFCISNSCLLTLKYTTTNKLTIFNYKIDKTNKIYIIENKIKQTEKTF